MSARAAVLAYIVVSGLVLLLMMLLGLTMRLAQAQWINIQPDFFYVIMTMHGAGMVGIAGLSGAAVMWYFVRRYAPVSTAVFVANLVFFLIGAVLILGAGFIGGFAAAWTFLFPLPAHSGELWSVNAAASYMAGLLFIGVGFLLLHLDIARGILSVYGGLGAALGVKQAFGLAPEDEGPPAAVTASTMVLIVNILGILLGAAVLVVSLVNLYVPSFAFNALAAKNMIFFFGHVFINATIYMAVIAVYEILPACTHRKWKTNRAFYFAWVLSAVMVLAVYPHHLLMDFAMPTWVLIASQIISWVSGLPVLLVTAFGALTNVYRSGIKWTVAAGLVFVGVAGWAIGVIPAIADGTIEVNSFMHNTQWVPGHFHTYLLLGMVAMFFGFMTYLVPRRTSALLPFGFWLYVVGGSVFVLSFLAAGSVSVPRRYAVHLPEWLPYDRVASIGAALTVLGALILVLNFVIGLPSAMREEAET
ncbi:cbb3-type cytochrome c oxidase subunit I [Nitrobacter sp. JJSN]|uniref:cbb3-type cytochrome c oxidase subunit I n=1 Tax=Nitrobacter sp. JJSN TaxID=3453033 RepID=UPI003F767EB5